MIIIIEKIRRYAALRRFHELSCSTDGKGETVFLFTGRGEPEV